MSTVLQLPPTRKFFGCGKRKLELKGIDFIVISFKLLQKVAKVRLCHTIIP
jgi:hypothetical protein